jgi:hypothetical protein
MGLGFVFEGKALAGDKLQGHSGSTRIFHFKPHFQVALRNPHEVDAVRLPNFDRDLYLITRPQGEDSFAGFRSRYIHLSVSLRSVRDESGARNGLGASHANGANRFYLSPRTFAHFWSW